MPGMLDEATVNAILSFQNYYNTLSETQLPLIDPMEPVIDNETLNVLAYADTRFANPYPADDVTPASDSYGQSEPGEAYDDSEAYAEEAEAYADDSAEEDYADDGEYAGEE